MSPDKDGEASTFRYSRGGDEADFYLIYDGAMKFIQCYLLKEYLIAVSLSFVNEP